MSKNETAAMADLKRHAMQAIARNISDRAMDSITKEIMPLIEVNVEMYQMLQELMHSHNGLSAQMTDDIFKLLEKARSAR